MQSKTHSHIVRIYRKHEKKKEQKNVECEKLVDAVLWCFGALHNFFLHLPVKRFLCVSISKNQSENWKEIVYFIWMTFSFCAMGVHSDTNQWQRKKRVEHSRTSTANEKKIWLTHIKIVSKWDFLYLIWIEIINVNRRRWFNRKTKYLKWMLWLLLSISSNFPPASLYMLI